MSAINWKNKKCMKLYKKGPNPITTKTSTITTKKDQSQLAFYSHTAPVCLFQNQESLTHYCTTVTTDCIKQIDNKQCVNQKTPFTTCKWRFTACTERSSQSQLFSHTIHQPVYSTNRSLQQTINQRSYNLLINTQTVTAQATWI